jgi:hypothetical protein
MKAAQPWSLVHGASWLTAEGEVLVVPGFHEDWIQAHQDLVAGCRNVCEIVLRKSWISVAVFSEGYVELLAPSRRDPAVLDRIERLLGGNRGRWRQVLLMFMDEEGYEAIHPEDLDAEGRLQPARRTAIRREGCDAAAR